MKNVTFEDLNSIFSKARIKPFLRDGDTAHEVLRRYHDNIILSEAMLPTLHYLEICLRNQLDQVLKEYYTPNWLITPPIELKISENDSKKIEKMKKKNYGKKLVHDDLVAQMSFGFWCAFFHKRYDTIIWHQKDTFRTIFPNLIRNKRTRKYIEERILKIKEIRNRIAHHEPVWNHKISIIDAHRMCYELIQAMSSDALEMLSTIDRFPELHGQIENY